MCSLIAIPSVSVRANKVAYYTRFEGGRRRMSRLEREYLRSLKTYEVAKSKNELSKKSASRLREYIQLLCACAATKRVFSAERKKWFSFKVNFVTLTLQSAQVHSDRVIHNKIFREFIRAWKRQDNNLLYVWKAEAQANGNIHYHLLTNSFIHWRDLRNMWNYYCNKLGYCDRSNSADPNSTDIHSVKSLKNIASYCIKYMTKKNEGKRTIKIRKWHCSTALLTPHPVLEGEDNSTIESYTRLFNSGARIYVSDYVTCFFPNDAQFSKAEYLYSIRRQWIDKVKRLNRNLLE